MGTNFTDIATGANANAAVFNSPLDELDAAIENLKDGTTAFTTLQVSGNAGIGTSTFGTSADKCLALSNTATAPSDSANLVHLYAADVSASAVLCIYQETAPVAETDETKFSHKMKVILNGTEYFVMLCQT